jgi:hypothetical protein
MRPRFAPAAGGEALVTMSATASNVNAEATRAARSKPMEVLARLGLATRGVLYILMAIIIVELVRTRGSEDDQASNTGALEKIVEQPFGRGLLIIVAIGVAGYALWRFAEAWLNRDDKAIERVANVARGLVYVGLFVTSIRILTANRSSGQDGSGDQQVDTILDWPAGRWIVGAIALVVFGIAIYNLVRAVTGKWREDLDIGGLSEGARRAIEVIAWVGMIGRTIAFSLVGWFLLRAAVQYDKSEPVGLDQSLRNVAVEPWGPFVLIVTAIGLAAYGLFSFVEARWRRMYA